MTKVGHVITVSLPRSFDLTTLRFTACKMILHLRLQRYFLTNNRFRYTLSYLNENAVIDMRHEIIYAIYWHEGIAMILIEWHSKIYRALFSRVFVCKIYKSLFSHAFYRKIFLWEQLNALKGNKGIIISSLICAFNNTITITVLTKAIWKI